MTQPRTRAWFLPTSPRSPEKLGPELRLLDAFEGRIWDKVTQTAFAKRLATFESFEGEGSPGYTDFSARDRINRGPKALGLVRLAKQGLSITPAGRQLIAILDAQESGTDPREVLERSQRFFLRQLLKLQFPSPNHGAKDYRELFDIKPLRATLEVIAEVETLSVVELSAFCLPTTRASGIDRAKAAIVEYRAERASAPAGRERKEFDRAVVETVVRNLYSDDLLQAELEADNADAGIVAAHDIVAKKRSNLRDYSDAAIRYFRATGLFTIDGSLRLRLLPERRGDVERLLDEVTATADVFSTDEAFYENLGDPELPRLTVDSEEALRDRFVRLTADVPPVVATRHRIDVATASATELITAYRSLEGDAEATARIAMQTDLRDRPEQLDEIIAMFERILSRDGSVIDRPLFLEWNTWRAFQVINGGQIIGNFGMDRLGLPTTTAPGRGPDIVCEYPEAIIVVEVTLQRGATQAVTEGEPVTRHVGNRQREAQDAGDNRPVIGLFLAPKVRDEVVAHVWHQFTNATRTYGGGVRVIPLEISSLIAMLRSVRDQIPLQPRVVSDRMIRAALLRTERVDEIAWQEAVRDLFVSGADGAGA